MAKEDYYKILGVNKTDDKETIKKAYKKLALKYHPDRAAEDKKEEYEQKFKEMSEAYAVLSDDNKRKQYDSYGHDAFSGNGFSGNPFEGSDISSILREMFGSSFFSGGFGNFNYEDNYVDLDLQYRLTISFEEAIFGVEKEIEIKKYVLCDVCGGSGAKNNEFKACESCSGRGRITSEQRTIFGNVRQTRTCPSCSGKGKVPKINCSSCMGTGILHKKIKVKIKIPAGIDDGQILRVPNSGNESQDGKKGDLLLIIRVKKHNTFTRENDNLFMDLDVSFSQAALGDNVLIKAISGNTKIKIPSGIQSGTILRLKGKGVKNVSSYRVGDLFIKVRIKTPTNLSREQKELFKKLEKIKE